MRAFCVDCGLPFHREADEEWKIRCVPCFKKSKRAESVPATATTTDSFWKEQAMAAEHRVQALRRDYNALLAEFNRLTRQPRQSEFDRELVEQLPRLLMVAHPDKHNGSQAATKATQWLLSVRERLQ
jgi:hypothetical protein